MQGKKMIFSMVATNQNSQIKTVKIIWQVKKGLEEECLTPLNN